VDVNVGAFMNQGLLSENFIKINLNKLDQIIYFSEYLIIFKYPNTNDCFIIKLLRYK